MAERYVVCDSGPTVRLRHQLGISGDNVNERCLTQHFSWRVDATAKVGIDPLVDLASDLQDLVSMAANRPVAFESMHFWHPDVVRALPDESSRPIPIRVYVKWNVQGSHERRRLHEHDFLFTFNGFDGMAGVGRWMDAAERHRGSLGRVMASLYAETMFVSDRLLNCTAALEAFDRRHTNSRKRSTLKTRLGRCASLAGDPFTDLVGNVPAWMTAVIIERDDVAHNLGLRAQVSHTETYYLWQSLYWLFVMCMLRECDAPMTVFDRMPDYGPYRALRV